MMPAHNRPAFKLVIPAGEQQERTEIGAEWSTSRETVFSCRLKLPFDLKAGDELSFIRVPNEPKKESAPEQKQESRPAPRQRRAKGEPPRGAA